MPAGLLIEGASQIATLAGGPRRGTAQTDAGVLRDAGRLSIAVVDGSILAAGPEEEVSRSLEGQGVDPLALESIDARGGVVTPGLIDAHTHLLFSGTRERELRLRQGGASYLEILAAGGGILSTVERTRAATEEELRIHGRRWLGEMLRHGVTTIEAKSGYGLDVETELRLLQVVDDLGREGPIELVPTWLGAHAVPRELREQPDATNAYLATLLDEQLPRVAEQGIARFCDVFCELGVFDVDQSRRVLETGARHGLRPRLHADEIHDSGGAALAGELGAASADHLAAVSDAGIDALGSAADNGHGVVATLLPATTFYLMSEHYAPARRLIERGVPVALGTDFNPGTSPTPNLQLVLSIACLKLGLTAEEALVAVSANAALALGLEETHGTIEPGRLADLVIWDVPSVDTLPYWVGADLVRNVIKRGRLELSARMPSHPSQGGTIGEGITMAGR
jgi:imidazolonepropionase